MILQVQYWPNEQGVKPLVCMYNRGCFTSSSGGRERDFSVKLTRQEKVRKGCAIGVTVF